MPTFKFHGFTTGTAVSVSAQQGAMSDSASVQTWGETGSTSPITLALSATRTSGVAPFGTIYSADATSPEARVVIPFHDIEGVWDYDDPGNFTSLGNTPLWGTDRNIGYGPRGVHVHEDPGSYSVAHTAHDGTTSRTETMTITVEDPDVVFAGADTAVVSSGGNFSGAPSGASQFTSISAALSHLSGRSNQRLLLRHNETFTDTIEFSETSGSGRRIYVGRFGGTGKPLIDKSSTSGDGVRIGGDSYDEIVVCNLRIDGGYDATNPPSGAEPSGDGINFSGSGGAPKHAHKTVWGVEISNIGSVGIETGGTGGDVRSNLYVSNTKIEGWYSYGIHGGDTANFGFAGVTVQQPTGTYNGSDGATPPWWARVTCFRLSRPAGPTVVSNCDVACFNNWAASNGNRGMQTLFRWNAGTNSDQELVIERLRGEGGSMQIYNSTGGGDGITDNFVLLDRLHLINAPHSVAAVVIPMGGTTVRNSVVMAPDCVPGTSTGLRRMISGRPSEVGANQTVVSGAQTRRSEVYSCALGDLRSDANATNRTGSASERDFNPGDIDDIANQFFGNNIHHAPNMVTGGTMAHAPLDETPLFSVRYDGERWQGAPVDTSRAYNDDATAILRPLPGSAAIGGASGKVSLLDFDGNLRSDVLAQLTRGTASIGPYEPNLEN